MVRTGDLALQPSRVEIQARAYKAVNIIANFRARVANKRRELIALTRREFNCMK